MSDDALILNGVCKRFARFRLENVSFRLPRGYIMGLIGPNGAGKTTTIKLMLGMLVPDEGSISMLGMDSRRDEKQIKQRIGVVMDQPFYLDDWRVKEVESALSPFYPTWDRGLFSKLCERFSLDPKSKVKELSRGMGMKLMIACALSHQAELLILDEPTSGLDAVMRDDLMDILKEYVLDEGRSVLFSTHITQDLEKIADYITFLSGGRVRYTGLKDDLMEKYRLVKGGANALSEEQKKLLSGLRMHSTGFDGLIETANLSRLPQGIIDEPCTLDEIIIRLNQEGERHV